MFSFTVIGTPYSGPAGGGLSADLRRPCLIGEHNVDRVHGWIDLLDPGEVGVDDLAARDLAASGSSP